MKRRPAGFLTWLAVVGITHCAAPAAAEQGDLWDSGKVVSSESIGIVYAGKPLTSRMEVSWKVRVWDKDQSVSAYSEPAFWEMALLSPTGGWATGAGRSNGALPIRSCSTICTDTTATAG